MCCVPAELTENRVRYVLFFVRLFFLACVREAEEKRNIEFSVNVLRSDFSSDFSTE